jgi:hypothetical protein
MLLERVNHNENSSGVTPDAIILGRGLYENPDQPNTMDRLVHLLHAGSGSIPNDTGIPLIDLPLRGIQRTQFGGLPIEVSQLGLERQLEVGPYQYIGDPYIVSDKHGDPYANIHLLKNRGGLFAILSDIYGQRMLSLDADPDAVLNACNFLAGLEAVRQAEQYGNVLSLLQVRGQQMLSAFQAMQTALATGLANQREVIHGLEHGTLADKRIQEWMHQIVKWELDEFSRKKVHPRYSDTDTYTDTQTWAIPPGLDADAGISGGFDQGGVDVKSEITIPVPMQGSKGIIISARNEVHLGPSSFHISVTSGLGRHR